MLKKPDGYQALVFLERGQLVLAVLDLHLHKVNALQIIIYLRAHVSKDPRALPQYGPRY
jgi:DNA-binding response OmpR family regulator